ncbi:MAG: hypothetical protein K2W80_04260 [Burkholderiales bacterium]|nr:hypothetical protein [Burkholderiales bacterium]
MTDLQGALIVLGVLAVAAVAIYNYWQERQFRRKSEKVLPPADRDVLLPEAPADGMPASEPRDGVPSEPDGSSRREPSLGERAMADERVEPRLVGSLDPGVPEASEVPLHAMPVDDTPAAGGLERPSGRRPEARVEGRSDPASALEGPAGLWYPVVFRLPAVADGAALAVIRSEVSGEARLSDWLDPDVLAAGDAVPGEAPTVDRILRIQAVDPRGPASAAELQAFLANAHGAASAVGGLATAPDPAATAGHAAALHEFCSSVDVAIGLNVAAASGGFSGTKLRGLIEAAGFRALPDHTYVLADDTGTTLCTLTDGNGGGLDPQAMRSQSVRAISLLLDVPRTPGTVAQFERMVSQARQFAQGLSGSVVDDSGRVLDEASIGRIRAQLASMLKAMRARGIEPGDPVARRIFG